MIEKMYTIKEVMKILGVCEKTVHRYIKPGYKLQLKAYKVGNEWRIKESDLMEFIEGTRNG